MDITNLKYSELVYWSVACFFCRNGCKRGKKGGIVCYHLKEENIVNIDLYVNYMAITNKDPSCCVVYMDESYLIYV